MPITLATLAPAQIDWFRHRKAMGPAPSPSELDLDDANAMPRDAAFVALQVAYRSRGGLASGEELAVSMSRTGGDGYVALARRLVAGQLFSFRWHDRFWVPRFQLHPVSMAPRAAPVAVLDELFGVFDGWSLAHWFVHRHDDLDGERPLDLLDTDLPAVLAAARTDRYAVDA